MEKVTDETGRATRRVFYKSLGLLSYSIILHETYIVVK